jgi:hypothetical protein
LIPELIAVVGIGHSDRVSRASPSRDVMSRPRGWPVAGPCGGAGCPCGGPLFA